MNRQYWLNNLWFGEMSRKDNILEHGVDLFMGAELVQSHILPDRNKVWGIDVSHWNGLVDMETAKKNGCSFVIIKAADGAVRTRYFQENKTRATEAGLPWGAYVWLYPDNRVPVKEQVDLWWGLFEFNYPQVGVHIDFEWTKFMGLPANPNASDLKKALDMFGVRSGRLAEVYTAKGYADEYLVGFPNPERYKWWIANYGVSIPNLPSLLVQNDVGWHKWQFTASLDGSIAPSQNKELDGNYYAGDHYQFAHEYLGGELPPDDGDTMSKYYRWTASAANIRVGPGKDYADKGDLVTGDVIQVDAPAVSGWLPFKIAQHSNGSFVETTDDVLLNGTQAGTYWATSAYFVEVSGLPSPFPSPDPQPTPDEPGLPDLPVTIVLGDDITYVKQTINVVLKPK